jgi:hypothetical protein
MPALRLGIRQSCRSIGRNERRATDQPPTRSRRR